MQKTRRVANRTTIFFAAKSNRSAAILALKFFLANRHEQFFHRQETPRDPADARVSLRDWIFVRDRIARGQRAQRQNRGRLCEARARPRGAIDDPRRRKRRKNQRFLVSRGAAARRGVRPVKEDGNFDRRRSAKFETGEERGRRDARTSESASRGNALRRNSNERNFWTDGISGREVPAIAP